MIWIILGVAYFALSGAAQAFDDHFEGDPRDWDGE